MRRGRFTLVALSAVAFSSLDSCGAPADDSAPAVRPSASEARFVPLEVESAARWVAEHAIRFDSATVSDTVLGDIVDRASDSRIAMLGGAELESAQQVRLKLSLVRALHERGGFNVIALDGPVWECTPKLNPAVHYDDMLAESCAYPFGERSRETDALFQYVVSTRATGRPLELVGIDAWRATSRASVERPAVLSALASRFDMPRASELYRLDSMLSAHTREANQALVLERYGSRPARSTTDSLRFSSEDAMLYDFFEQQFSAAAARPGVSDVDRARLAMASMVARSSAYVVRLLAQRMSPVTRGRDRLLAENLIFVADTIYPAQKMIVWSQNRHVQRGTTFSGTAAVQPAMGEVVSSRRPDYHALSLGILTTWRAARGKSGTSGILASGNLPVLLHDSAGRSTYLDVGAAKSDPGAAALLDLAMVSEPPRSPPIAIRYAFDALISITGSTRLTTRPLRPAPPCCPARAGTR